MSKAQVDQARIALREHNNVEIKIGGGERLEVEDASIHLVSTCQALHWIQLEQFYSEVSVSAGCVDENMGQDLCGSGDALRTADTALCEVASDQVGVQLSTQNIGCGLSSFGLGMIAKDIADLTLQGV